MRIYEREGGPSRGKVTFEGEESAQAMLTDFLAKVSNVWEALADCLAAGSATSPTAPDVRALHATLSNFEADSRSGKSPTSTPGTTVTMEQLGRFVNSEMVVFFCSSSQVAEIW